eukprot:216629_1
MGVIFSRLRQQTVLDEFYANKSQCLTKAISSHIHRIATSNGIELPSEIVELCMTHIGFVMETHILSEKEQSLFFEHISTKTNINNSAIVCIESLCSFIYDPVTGIQFEATQLVNAVQDKRNVLLVLETEFGHVFTIFVDCAKICKDSKRIITGYLLRSMFTLCECPKEFGFNNNAIYYDFYREHEYIGFCGMSLTEKGCMIISDGITKCNGNEIIGGLSFDKNGSKYSFKVTKVEAFQIIT